MGKSTLTAIATLIGAAVADQCKQYPNCHDCLNPRDPALNCGWCSPSPAEFPSGEKATQCMDHTSKGWDCFHLYMHDGCVAGYVCDHTSGQCTLGAAGTGDTKENCELACTPTPVENHYSCNATTFTCDKVPAGGSSSKTGCDSSCSNSTPASLLGLWRGLDVQTGFTLGEYEMNFTNHTVAWGPLADPRQYQATVATLSDTQVRLTLTAPAADAGAIRYVTYSTPGWPTGPETNAMSVAIQRAESHQVPPHNTADAMGDKNFDVYVFNKCNSYSKGCSFAKAFTPPVPAAIVTARSLFSFVTGAVDDKCTVHTDCGSCIDDPLKVCGWCDGTITFGDGTTCGADGKGCCGGASGFSKCNVAYRKECPVVCDWTNWTNPFCRPATGHEISDKTQQKFQDCELVEKYNACKYVFGHYCNTTEMQCHDVATKDECVKTPGCDPANPQCTDCKAIEYFYCDKTGKTGCKGPLNKTACDNNPQCDSKSAQCDPTVCAATEFYTCDKNSFQCIRHTGTPTDPHFNDSKQCEDACYDNDVSGVWRGLRIDSGFVVDEWDFIFEEQVEKVAGKLTYSSKNEAKVYTGKYEIGEALNDGNFASFKMEVTLSTGEVWSGLFSNKDQGPITKFLYLGLPLTTGEQASSFDDAMSSAKQEFVLIACKSTVGKCDFSPAKPGSAIA